MFGIASCILGIIYLTGIYEVGTWLAICSICTFIFDSLLIILKIRGKRKNDYWRI